MKRRTSISVCALLAVMVASLAQGATIRYYGNGDYNDTTNSTAEVNGWQSTVLPGSGDQIRVNYGGVVPFGNTCTLTNVAPNVANFQIGVDQSGIMVVESGGMLTTVANSANAVGYNGGTVTGRMTVNTNGVVNSGYYLRVGYNGIGVLTIDGGTVNDAHHLWVGGGATGNGTIILTNGGTLNMTHTNGTGLNGMLGLGTGDAVAKSGGVGYIYVRGGGVLNLYNIEPGGSSITNSSVLDISGSGVVTIGGDRTTIMSNYVYWGKITAYGGTGTVAIDYNTSNPGKTTLKAVGGYVAPTEVTWIANSGTGLWSENANWSGGLRPASVTTVNFTNAGAIPCTVNDSAMADCIVMGTNGPGGTLIITNTGTLSCGGTNANYIGYDHNALMVVENGASVSFGSPLRLGFNSGSEGTLLMNGGTVSVAGMFDLGYQGGKGTVLVKGGTLDLSQFNDDTSIAGASLIDISGTGQLVLNGNHQLAMNYYIIIAGQIINSSGAGLLVDYDIIHSGKTTVYPANLVLGPEQAVWNPAANPLTTGMWNESANWTAGMCPGDATVVTFNVADAIPCIVSNAALAGYISMGNSGGPGGTLIITNGGSLTTFASHWCAAGYSSNALMIVENGGSASFASHLWVGLDPGSDGTFIMNGGTVSVREMFGLGWQGGKGTVHINGGTLNLAQWHPTDSIKGASVLNLTDTGTALITGNYVTSISNFVAAGKITANGGAGTVAYGFDSAANKTIVQVAPPRQSITSAAVSGGNTTLTYQTTAGHIYHIESTASLFPATWRSVAGSSTNAAGASVTFTFPAGAAQTFYRTVSP